MPPYCKICHQPNCKKHSFLIPKPIKIDSFSGSSPPEIFVGRWNYPNVYAGILSPPDLHGPTNKLSSPEIWQSENLQIPKILNLRQQLVYGRSTTNIKAPTSLQKSKPRFLQTFQEIALTHKSTETLFKLEKPIAKNKEQDSRTPLISRASTLKSAKITENTSVLKKVDYLTSDVHVKSAQAMQELDQSKVQTTNIIKILSAGLLGLKKNRKLVPTRWSITATDDTLSKAKLKKIRYLPEIQHYEVHHAEYLGNHYEFLLMPDTWSFEVIEISLKGFSVWQDHETFFQRKKYADNVTGAYYVNRLAACEYLSKIKRQATILVFREIRPEYYAPLGVGILRQTSRAAFENGKKFHTLQDALADINSRLRIHIDKFTEKSVLLNTKKEQTKLTNFL
tara:strand:+ start:2566 stop:3747 length:1182 start_codon:yes stop_codon:yes gene_type:complete